MRTVRSRQIAVVQLQRVIRGHLGRRSATTAQSLQQAAVAIQRAVRYRPDSLRGYHSYLVQGGFDTWTIAVYFYRIRVPHMRRRCGVLLTSH